MSVRRLRPWWSDSRNGVSGDPGAVQTGTLTGELALGGNLDNAFFQGGYAWFLRGTITLAPIPEPSTALLLATGLAGLAVAGRRRRVL